MPRPSHDFALLIDAVSSPFRIGVYENGNLIETIEGHGKLSESLLALLYPLTERYRPSRIVYTNGPGSFMAIKLAYITLKTLQSIRPFTLLGCSYFNLNGNQPVKAMGKLYFLKEQKSIITKKIETPPETELIALPQRLDQIELEEDALPQYRISAV